MNVPQLRFKEFSGDWVKSKLGDISSYTKGFAFKSEHYKESGTRIIRVSDLSESSIRNNNEKIFIDTSTESDFKKYVIREGDIIITTVGSKPELIESAVGRAIYIKEPVGLLNQNLLKVECLEYINSYFIFSQIGTNRYLTHIKNIQRGNANQSNITVNDLFEYLIHTPTLPEQTKIANFLTTIDERISQLTHKKELMTQYKQGVMQQIFSQQLRFKDDNGEDFGDWIECFLIDFAQNGNLTNGVFNDPNKVGKGYKLINVLDMYIDGWINEDNLNLIDLDEKEFLKNKVQNGDVFFTRSSLVKEGIAFSNIYMGHSDDITYDGHLIKMTPNKEVISPIFLNYLLKCSDIRTQLVSRGKTATMTTIGQKDIASVTVKYPCLAEQTKIANFLTALDEKIQHIAKQIEATKQYKQGLLQQMFV